MGGKMSRNKGANFEREIARKLRGLFPDAMRELEYQEARGVDVTAGPFVIQCKRKKNYVSVSKIDEIKTDLGMKVLIAKADRQPIICVVPARDYNLTYQHAGVLIQAQNPSIKKLKDCVEVHHVVAFNWRGVYYYAMTFDWFLGYAKDAAEAYGKRMQNEQDLENQSLIG